MSKGLRATFPTELFNSTFGKNLNHPTLPEIRVFGQRWMICGLSGIARRALVERIVGSRLVRGLFFLLRYGRSFNSCRKNVDKIRTTERWLWNSKMRFSFQTLPQQRLRCPGRQQPDPHFAGHVRRSTLRDCRCHFRTAERAHACVRTGPGQQPVYQPDAAGCGGLTLSGALAVEVTDPEKPAAPVVGR